MFRSYTYTKPFYIKRLTIWEFQKLRKSLESVRHRHWGMSVQNKRGGVVEWWLSNQQLAAPMQDVSSGPSTHVIWLTTFSNSSSRGSDASLNRHLYTCDVYAHTPTQTFYQKKKRKENEICVNSPDHQNDMKFNSRPPSYCCKSQRPPKLRLTIQDPSGFG